MYITTKKECFIEAYQRCFEVPHVVLNTFVGYVISESILSLGFLLWVTALRVKCRETIPQVTFDPFRSYAEALLFEKPKPVRTQCRHIDTDAPFIRPTFMNNVKVHFRHNVFVIS